MVRHTHRGNLFVHLISALSFFVAPWIALLTFNPWWLLPFFASGGMGAFGHWFFGDGGVNAREATSAPEVPSYVLYMFWMLAAGTWSDEVRLAQAAHRVDHAEGSNRLT